MLFARSATAGGQQFPVHWGGDCESTFEAMAETLRGGLSLAASGFAYWSHDIGGFEGTPDAGVFKRWLAFGLLSSHSRLHGSNSLSGAVGVRRRGGRRGPPVHRAEAVADALPRPARGRGATASGTPMLRPMVLEFPDDPAVEYLDTQYMLGDSLLVAPVFQPTGPGAVLRSGGPLDLPAGRHRGHRPRLAVNRTTAFDSLPLLVRPGTVLPRGARRDRPDYHYADGIALHVYGVEALRHSTVRIPGTDDIDDSVFDVEFNDGTLTVSRTSGPEVSWSVVLPAGSRPASATGGRARVDFRRRTPDRHVRRLHHCRTSRLIDRRPRSPSHRKPLREEGIACAAAA